ALRASRRRPMDRVARIRQSSARPPPAKCRLTSGRSARRETKAMENTNEARRAAVRGPDARATRGRSESGGARAGPVGKRFVDCVSSTELPAAQHTAQTQEAVRLVVQQANRRSTSTDRRGTVMKTKFISTLVSITFETSVLMNLVFMTVPLLSVLVERRLA